MTSSFRYVAATANNEIRDGVIEAESMRAAIDILHGRGLFVIRISRPSRLSTLWSVLNRDVNLRPPLPENELARLSQEWGGLIEAGIPVEESLALLEQTSSPSARKVLLAVRQSVKAGMPLYEALGQFPTSFPSVYRALIAAGESAGNLGPVIRRLGEDLIIRRALIEDIRNALLYPLFLLMTAVAGILVLLLIVVPNLEALIGEEGESRLPLITQVVLAVSHGLRDFGFLFLAAVAILLLTTVLVVLTPSGRVRLDGFILKCPVLGSLVTGVETGRFARTLSALLSGGVVVSAAMQIALQTVGNRRMRAGLAEAHQSIVSGMAIGDAIAAVHVFREDAIGMIRVGERTGRLAAALEWTAAQHEARSARQLKALTTMLTPLLTIGFGAVAGIIVYAMLSTILSINELASQ